ncbi:hypothetical protein DFH06DRAFT_1191478 [Mycena polygramma]|nr:hypothetical protein DFH06DRAFT_1191478 [Mycena polygramma]
MRQAYQQQTPPQLAHSHSQTNLHHAPREMSRSLSHSQSHRSLRQAYEDERPHHEQHPYNPVPPGYGNGKHHAQPLHSPIDNHSSGSSQVASPEVYMDDSPLHSPYQTLNPQYWPASGYAPTESAPAPTHAPAHTHAPAQQSQRHRYDPQDPRHRIPLDEHQQQLRQANLQMGRPPTEAYTADRATESFAAADPPFQEHWSMYMSNVMSSFLLEREDGQS